MTSPAAFHLDDGHALPVDLMGMPEHVEAAEKWVKHFRPHFREGVFVVRLENEVAFIPAERVSFITIPLDAL